MLDKVFITVIVAGILSQGSKIVLNHIKDRKGFSIPDLVVTGGMPSTHSALVCSLFVSLLFDQGLTGLSAIAMVLFVIVVTDSMGVRRTAGEEAKAVNKIIKLGKLKIHTIDYALGHRPIEVLAGVIIGVVVSLIIWVI